ncbi:reverse transcriptase [Plakobranchus ocellatus]|uniref:Reverse transcriptase n=1 Tax=Plakobranchus ocellatus TaxID=259542 RepID=A0AAV4BQC1_9GAST|nr:reverse transcriptase [Plakobranchus ocellatus]
MTDRKNVDVAIAMVCTIFPNLFSWLWKLSSEHQRGCEAGGGNCMPRLKTFMDDTAILCSKENETRIMLLRSDALMNWSRMTYEQKKSRSLSIRK